MINDEFRFFGGSGDDKKSNFELDKWTLKVNSTIFTHIKYKFYAFCHFKSPIFISYIIVASILQKKTIK